MEIHSGHRERMKERFLEEGFSSFTEIQALEMLLFYSVPRQDTNLLAHRLLSAFGSLYNIFEADARDISAVQGIGMHSAVLIKLLPEITRKYWINGPESSPQIAAFEDASEFIKPYLFGKPVEHVYLFCLDSQFHFKHAECISTGTVNDAVIHIRKIAECAIRLHSGKVFLAHNHPGGNPEPSSADIKTTLAIREALAPLGIELVDHLIFSNHSCRGLLSKGCLEQSSPGQAETFNK